MSHRLTFFGAYWPAEAAGAGLARPGASVELHQLLGETVDLLDVVGDDADTVDQAAEHPATDAVDVDEQTSLGAEELDLLPQSEAFLEGEGEGGAGEVSHAGDSTAPWAGWCE